MLSKLSRTTKREWTHGKRKPIRLQKKLEVQVEKAKEAEEKLRQRQEKQQQEKEKRQQLLQ